MAIQQPSWADELDKIQAQCNVWEERWEAEERAEALDAVDAARAALRAATVRAARLTAEDGVFELVAAPAVEPAPKIDSPFLTVEEAAAYCKVAVQTIYNHRRNIERMPGTRKLLFRRESLERWLCTRSKRKRT